MTETRKTRKALNQYPVRACYSMHACCECREKIENGQRYYDGGLNRRAHIDCGNAAAAREDKA